MKKISFFHPLVGIIAFIISISLFFAGCVTTHSIIFASAEQPDRNNGPIMVYKHVTIAARSHNTSVLERFYEMYPNHKYQVVAYEKVSTKYWIPLIGLGSGLLGSLIGGSGGEKGISIGLSIGLCIGSVLGYFTENTYYVITYVER